MTAHAQPPEARLIREKREAIVPRLSVRQAAADAEADGLGSFSPTLWAQIEKGTMHGTRDRIARMARVIHATPADLGRCGRPDAAQALRDIPVRDTSRSTLRERADRLVQLVNELARDIADDEEEGDRARRRA